VTADLPGGYPLFSFGIERLIQRVGRIFMTLAPIVLICYIVLTVLGIVLMRRAGIGRFDSLSFAVKLAAIFWLLLLFGYFSTSDGSPQSQVYGNWWIQWVCLLLAVLLIPFTVLGTARMARFGVLTSEEKANVMQATKARSQQALVTLFIAVCWLLFLGGKTFFYVRTHSVAILLGILVSAGVGWIGIVIIKRWQQRKRDED
jgi:hypothetical protein